MAQKRKTWLMDSIGVSYDFACLEDMDEPFRERFRIRLKRLLDQQRPAMQGIAREIAALKLRRPYHGISIELTSRAVSLPSIEKRLFDTALKVPIHCDLRKVLETLQPTDAAISEFFIARVQEGLEIVGADRDLLRPAFEAGVTTIRTNNYVIRDVKPFRSRVVGADLFIEVSYEHSPTQRFCNLKFWRPGKTKVCFTHRFIVVPEPEDPLVVRMYIHTPVQGAVRDGEMIRFAITSWQDSPQGGMTANPEVADQAISLPFIEKTIGPVTRLAKSGKLRVL